MHIHMHISSNLYLTLKGKMSTIHTYTLAHHRGMLIVAARVSFDPIVRTLPHTLLTTRTVQIIDVDGQCTLNVYGRGSSSTLA